MTSSFQEIALNPTVVASMIAATSAGFGGLMGWFFNRLVARTERRTQNVTAQLQGWANLTTSLTDRIKAMETSIEKKDQLVTEYLGRLLQCEKERVSLTRDNVRLMARMRE